MNRPDDDSRIRCYVERYPHGVEALTIMRPDSVEYVVSTNWQQVWNRIEPMGPHSLGRRRLAAAQQDRMAAWHAREEARRVAEKV